MKIVMRRVRGDLERERRRKMKKFARISLFFGVLIVGLLVGLLVFSLVNYGELVGNYEESGFVDRFVPSITGFVVSAGGGEERDNRDDNGFISEDNEVLLEINSPSILEDNGNERMDFNFEGNNIRLYFDMLDYDDFIERANDALIGKGVIGIQEIEIIDIGGGLIGGDGFEGVEGEVEDGDEGEDSDGDEGEGGDGEGEGEGGGGEDIESSHNDNDNDGESGDDGGESSDGDENENENEDENSDESGDENEDESGDENSESSGPEDVGDTKMEDEGRGEDNEGNDDVEEEVKEVVEENGDSNIVNLIGVLADLPKGITGLVVSEGEGDGNFSGVNGEGGSLVGAGKMRDKKGEIVKEYIDELDDDEIDEIVDGVVMPAEDFEIVVDENGARENNVDYKWGYKVKLNDMDFMAKVDVGSDEAIDILNDHSLKIGSSVLSFSDLVDLGYSVRVDVPELAGVDNVLVDGVDGGGEEGGEGNEGNEGDEGEVENGGLDEGDEGVEDGLGEGDGGDGGEEGVEGGDGGDESGGGGNDSSGEQDGADSGGGNEGEDGVGEGGEESEDIVEEVVDPVLIEGPELVEDVEEGQGEEVVDGEEVIEEETVDEEIVEGVVGEEPVGEQIIEEEVVEEVEDSSNVVESPSFINNLIGAFVQIPRIIGSVIGVDGSSLYEVSVFIERDFSLSNELVVGRDFVDVDGDGVVSLGDILILDPTLIRVTKASHLDSDRSFISDVYEEVREQDEVYSEQIKEGDYVRVTFERNLTNGNDITFYARPVNGTNASVEVYRKDQDEMLLSFEDVNSEGLYREVFGNLSSWRVFDLNVTNGIVEFDWIVDPSPNFGTADCDVGGVGPGTTCELNHTYFVSDGDVVNATNLVIQDSGSIANTTEFEGIEWTINLTGNLTILSGGSINGSGNDSASPFGAAGNGSTIHIIAEELNLTSKGFIYAKGGDIPSASYIFAGLGGTINISVTNLYLDGNVSIDGGDHVGGSSSGRGVGAGTLIIDTGGNLIIKGNIFGRGGTGDRDGSERGNGGKLLINEPDYNLTVNGTIDLNPGELGGSNDGDWVSSSINVSYLTVNSEGIVRMHGDINATEVTVKGILGSEGIYGNSGTSAPILGGNLTMNVVGLNVTSSGLIDGSGGNLSGSGTVFGGKGGIININTTNLYLDGNISIDGGTWKTGSGAGGDAGILVINVSNNTDINGNIFGRGGRGSNSCGTNYGRKGSGGKITLNSQGYNLTILGKILVDHGSYGACDDGLGGTVNISAQILNITNIISALGGNESSGNITLYGRELYINSTINVTQNNETGSNGSVRLMFDSVINISNSRIEPVTYIARNNSKGRLWYLSAFNGTFDESVDWDSVLSVHGGNISVDTSAYGQLNLSAELWFYDLRSNFLLRDGIECSTTVCSLIQSSPFTKMNVTGFSDFSVGFDCDEGDVNSTCNITTIHNVADDTKFSANNLIIKSGGSLYNGTANCSGTSHGCGFSIDLNGNFTIQSGGNMSAGNISVNASNIDVQSGGLVNTRDLGFMDNTGPGSSTGATHAGYGHNGLRQPYGNATAPTTMGSGGSAASGGGVVKLISIGNVTLNGNITVDGGGGSTTGSGGSIWIIGNIIEGIGYISAQGADGNDDSSGGRLRFEYTENITYTGIIDLSGGPGAWAGSFTFTNNTWPGNWIVNGTVGLLGGDYGEPALRTNITNILGSLTVPSGSEIWAYGDCYGNYTDYNRNNCYNQTDEGLGVWINASGNITVESGASIIGDRLGFQPRMGPSGTTYGASHGGKGSGALLDTYGDPFYPISLGSGGGDSGGGSAIRLETVNVITVAGPIDFDGGSGGNTLGAGGSILLIGDLVNISSELNTSAYNANDDGGAGRIAVHGNTVYISDRINNLGQGGGWGGSVYLNATNNLTSTGNISATGYNGSTAYINFTATKLIVTGIYNVTAVAGVNGTMMINYTDCQLSDVSGTFSPYSSLVNNTNCELVKPLISFVAPTPGNNTFTANSSLEFNVSITEWNLDEVKWNWNGTNYTLMNDSLVLFMNFDNISTLGENETNNHTQDISKYNNSGVCFNMDGGACNWNITNSKYGAAMEFDGTDDYVNLSDNLLTGATTWSISLWLYNRDIDNSHSPFGGNLGFVNHLPTVRFSSSNYQFYATNDAASSYFVNGVSTSSAATTNQWEHLIYMYNSSNLLVYRDGILSDTLAATNDQAMASTSTTDRIGGRSGASAIYYNGSIDEVQVWNRSLNASEVYQLYASNLRKYDAQNWSLYVNQSLNGSDGLVDATYIYSSSAKDNDGNENLTDLRSVTVSSTGNLSSCLVLDTPNNAYTLINDVSSTWTCFNVTAENVTLDCAGYTINYSYDGTAGYGVFSNSFNTSLRNCDIVEGVGTTGYKHAVYFSGNSNSSIFNSTIRTYGTSSSGIAFVSSSYNNVTGVNVTINGVSSVGLEGINSNDNVYYDANLTVNGGGSQYGILLNPGSRNLFKDINIDLSEDFGIALLNSAWDNIFINVNSSTPDYGIWFRPLSENDIINATVIDSYIEGTIYGTDGMLPGSVGNFINVTFNQSNAILEDADFYLNVQWYVDVNVTSNEDDTPLNGALVNISSRNVTQEFSGTTNSSGQIARLNLTEYTQNWTGHVNKTYHTNYSLNSTFLNFNLYDLSFNLTGNRLLNVSMIPLVPPNVDINSPINRTYNRTFVEFNVTSGTGRTYSTCVFSLDGYKTNYSMSINSSSTGANYTLYTISDGGYRTNFWCNDTFGNINDSETLDFTIESGINGSSIGLSTDKVYVNYNETVNLSLNIAPLSYGIFNVSRVWAEVTNVSGDKSNVTLVNGSSPIVWNGTYTHSGLGNYVVNYFANLSNSERLFENVSSNFSVQNTTISVSSNVSAVNTTDVMYVNGVIYRYNGSDSIAVSNNPISIKVGGVFVTSDIYNDSNFTNGSVSGANASDVVKLNLSVEGSVTRYNDSFDGTERFGNDSYNYSGISWQAGKIFEGDAGLPTTANVTYLFNATSKFFNASAFAVTESSSDGGANISVLWSLNNTNWNLIDSSTSSNDRVGGYFNIDSRNSFYVMIRSDASVGIENPVVDLEINRTEYEYGTAGNFTSASFHFPNVTYTTLSWSENLNGSGEMLIQLRDSANGTTWNDWTSNYTNTLTNDISALTERYVQYRAWLNTSNASITPILYEVNISFLNVSTNSTGGYQHNATIPTNNLGGHLLEVAVLHNSFTGIVGANDSTNITIWTKTDVSYTAIKNYSQTLANYSVTANFTRTDTGSLVNGTFNISIMNITGYVNNSMTCIGVDVCTASWTLPTRYNGEVDQNNYSINITVSNDSSYFVNATVGYYDDLEERNTTATIESSNRTIPDFSAGSDYSFMHNVTINNTGLASLNNTYVFYSTVATSSDVKSINQVRNCTRIFVNGTCNAEVNITIDGGASSGDKFISWRMNWTDNDGGVSGGASDGYVTYTKMYVIITLNASLGLNTSSVNRTLEHGQGLNFSFQAQSDGTDSVLNINLTFLEGNITDGYNLSSDWVKSGPSFISGLTAGQDQDIIVNVSIPNQTTPGNYSGRINVSSSNGGEKFLRLIVEVPSNGSWYLSPSSNFSFNNSFSLNDPGEVGNYSIVNIGNINITFNVTYDNNGSVDYHDFGTALFETNDSSSASGLTVNPLLLDVDKGTTGLMTFYQKGRNQDLNNVGVVIRIRNDSADQADVSFQDAFNINEAIPNVPTILFILDDLIGNVGEVNKNVTIKVQVRDDIAVNETNTTIIVYNGTTNVTINATSLCGNFGECVGSEGSRTIVNFSANFTPTIAGQYNVTATGYDLNGQVNTSVTFNFTSYAITTMSSANNASVVDLNNVDSNTLQTIYVNYSLNNTGNTFAYDPNISFSGDSSIGFHPNSYNFSDMKNGTSNNSYVFQINVSKLTSPGIYNITANISWRNPDNTMGSVRNVLTINVTSNKSMAFGPSTLNLSVGGGGQNSTTLTINSTGNDLLTNVNLSCLSGDACTSFTITINETNINISANDSKIVNFTFGSNRGLAGGTYTGVVNVSERNISKTFAIEVSVPQSYTWSVSPSYINKSKGTSQVGSLEEVTIENTGNNNLTFLLNSTNFTFLQPNQTSLFSQSLTNTTFTINFSAPSFEGEFILNITISNETANPTQRNVSVNFTSTKINVTVLSPSQSNNISNVTSGDLIEVHGNLTFDDAILNSNTSWNITINGTDCTNDVYSFLSSVSYWNITCSAPSLSDGRVYNLTALADNNEHGAVSQITSNSIIYRDVSPPSFNITKNDVNLGNYINLSVNVTDNVNKIDSVSAVLTYPNSSSVNISFVLSDGLYSNTSFNLTDAGEYLVNYSANDTTNNFNSSEGFFEVLDKYNWYPKFLDYKSSGVNNANLTLNRPNTSIVLIENITNSSGDTISLVNKRKYDLHVSISDSKVIVRNVNFTNITNNGVNLNLHRLAVDELSETISLHKTFQGIASNSTNLSGNSVSAVFNYSGLNYDNSNELEVVKCGSWNYTDRSCDGSWNVLSSSVDKDLTEVTGNSTGFSAYFLAEDKCGNGLCEASYGETTSTCSADCITAQEGTGGGSSGGGGGGGVSSSVLRKIEDIVKSFLNVGGIKLETTSIYKEVFAGDSTSFRIKLRNTVNAEKTVSLSAEGDVQELIFFESSEITLQPSEDRDVLIKVVAPKFIEPGNYDGDLVLTSGTESGKIPVTIRVLAPEGKLLDVKIQPLSPTARPGGVIRLQTDLLNLGKTKVVDVQFDLQLLDIETGEILNRKEEAFAVETSISVIKNLSVPEDVKRGRHMVKAVARYSNVESDGDFQASSIAYVNIQDPLLLRKLFGIIPLWIIFVFMLVVGLVVGGLFYIRYLAFKRKRFKTKVEFNKLPHPGPSSGFIGKIAETDVRSFVNLNKLMTHTLIAGSTGSGKTVAAQGIIEEALTHKKSVIVFDPTAQWTGFLRKSQDKKMMKRFKYFDMKTKSIRAYNGTIKTISDPYELINIKKYLYRPGEITIFNVSHLSPKEIDVVVASTIQQIFKSEPEESSELKTVIVYDEVHRLLPKFGGTGQGFVQLERGAREFRKWGIGLMLISQVLSDFVGEIKANIGTEVQMGTRYEGDLERVSMKYGEDVLKSVVKEPAGTGMVTNAEYNSGRPYFVAFRPLLHSTKRLSNDELKKYDKYFIEIEDLEYQSLVLKKLGVDIFDLKLEIKLTKDKVKQGQFQMADMYLESLRPRVEENWTKLGKKPMHLVKKKITRQEVLEGITKAKEERKKFVKKNPEAKVSFDEKILKLKNVLEEKKKKGVKTSQIEIKLESLKTKLKPFKGKEINKGDSLALQNEVETLMKEAEGLK